MITEQQERNLADAHGRAKKKQDRVNPHVINIDNGRLMPNTPRLRAHPKYRVYTGPKDADTDARMRWLDGATRVPKIVNTKAAADEFDVGTATLDEMVVFALENFGMTLDTKKPMKVLRAEIMAASEKLTQAEPELT